MKFLKIAKVNNTHGIRGEVKIHCKFIEYEKFIYINSELYYYDQLTYSYEKLIIKTVRKYRSYLLVQFQGYDNINEILFLKQHDLYFLADELIIHEPLDFKNYLGMKVTDVNTNETVGHIVNYFRTRAHGIYVINTRENQEKMIADTKQFIIKIDFDENVIYIDPKDLGNKW